MDSVAGTVAPAHAAGPAVVTVRTPNGEVSNPARFTYR